MKLVLHFTPEEFLELLHLMGGETDIEETSPSPDNLTYYCDCSGPEVCCLELALDESQAALIRSGTNLHAISVACPNLKSLRRFGTVVGENPDHCLIAYNEADFDAALMYCECTEADCDMRFIMTPEDQKQYLLHGDLIYAYSTACPKPVHTANRAVLARREDYLLTAWPNDLRKLIEEGFDVNPRDLSVYECDCGDCQQWFVLTPEDKAEVESQGFLAFYIRCPHLKDELEDGKVEVRRNGDYVIANWRGPETE